MKPVLCSLGIYWLASFMLPMRIIFEINMICKNFLWSRPDGETSHTLIRWDNMVFPYDEGGLGIRDLLTINKACVMRHIWYLIEYKEILWVLWVKKNIIKGIDFWAMKIPDNTSCS